MTRTYAVNEKGRRIGQDHHRATLTDADVELLLLLRAEGWGYGRLAKKFDVSKRHVRDICNGRKRNQIPAAWRVVPSNSGQTDGNDGR